MIKLHGRRIVIAGSSHKTALIGGVPTLHGETRLLPVAGRDRVFGLHGGTLPTESYWRILARHAPGNSIALSLGGNEHYWFFLFETCPRFDVMPRGLELLPVEEDAVIIPEAMVRAKFAAFRAPTLRTVMSILKGLSGTNTRIALLGSPPPKRENDRILAAYGRQNDEHQLTSSAKMLKLWHTLKADGHQYHEGQLTSSVKMLKLWRILQGTMQQEAEENGIQFIPVPDIAMADDGFLKEEFEDENYFMHANRAYGQLMLDHLEQNLLQG